MTSKTPAKKAAAKAKKAPARAPASQRFEAAKLDPLFVVLDAIAWMESPAAGEIAQFASIDRGTTGKLLKNASQLGLIDSVGKGYVLLLPYPYKGSQEQKKAVVKEALVRLPLLTSVRQFMLLGDKVEVALRKAATLAGIVPFNAVDLNPLLEWAQSMGALKPNLVAEDLLDDAEAKKEERHQAEKGKRIAFLSHSSTDKPFIRQLAADLTAAGIDVWLDEQRIRVGDSIPEAIAQGLAESDYFLIAISQNSVNSPWVQKELNNALVTEVQRRNVHIVPLRLDDTEMPRVISDKLYADFSHSYKAGLEKLLSALKRDV